MKTINKIDGREVKVGDILVMKDHVGLGLDTQQGDRVEVLDFVGYDCIKIKTPKGTTESYFTSRFRWPDKPEVDEEPGTYVLILREGKGSYAPAKTPRTFVSAKQAKAAALGMAERHPGQSFVVFKAVAEAFTKPVPKAEYQTY
jgi:hypothetical protein